MRRVAWVLVVGLVCALAGAQGRVLGVRDLSLRDRGQGWTMVEFARKDGRWEAGKELPLETEKTPIERVSLDPSGKYLVVERIGTKGFWVSVLDVSTGKLVSKSPEAKEFGSGWSWWAEGRLLVAQELKGGGERLMWFDPGSRKWEDGPESPPKSFDPLAPWNFDRTAYSKHALFVDRGIWGPPSAEQELEFRPSDMMGSGGDIGPGARTVALRHLVAQSNYEQEITVLRGGVLLGDVRLRAPERLGRVSLTDEYLVLTVAGEGLLAWHLERPDQAPEVLDADQLVEAQPTFDPYAPGGFESGWMVAEFESWDLMSLRRSLDTLKGLDAGTMAQPEGKRDSVSTIVLAAPRNWEEAVRRVRADEALAAYVQRQSDEYGDAYSTLFGPGFVKPPADPLLTRVLPELRKQALAKMGRPSERELVRPRWYAGELAGYDVAMIAGTTVVFRQVLADGTVGEWSEARTGVGL